MEDTIELRGRGARLVLRDGHVDIHVPYLFGSRPISVPVEAIAVNDPKPGGKRQTATSPDLAARTPMRIVPPPRFPATFKVWNTVLLFKKPIDLPRPRGAAIWLWAMFMRRRRNIYGLFVTALDAPAVPAVLAEWGVELIHDPRKWTERHWRA